MNAQHSVPAQAAVTSTEQQLYVDTKLQPGTNPQKSEAIEIKSPDKGDDSEDEEEGDILEESPCGRWQKRREPVTQRDVPGIDVAYLAMDTEEGVEVVWNEVKFSERKNIKNQLNKIRAVFDNLTELQHSNLVKFHKYWIDTESDPENPRVIFITEYMSSGPMSQYLKRTRQSGTPLKGGAWKKWCTQILSALSYLHSSDPSIIHGNLSCNTIFIQHNGLIKIGCVAPDAIHNHVKTCRAGDVKNMHYIAPEYEHGGTITPAADIFSFGMCALEIAALGFQTNGEGGTSVVVSPELITKTIESISDPLQRDFIEKCLIEDPNIRPSARELLFHAVLFEVHSLKLLSAHRIVRTKKFETLPEHVFRVSNTEEEKNKVISEIIHKDDGRPGKVLKRHEVKLIDLSKFLEDVRNGGYPLTAFAQSVTRMNVNMNFPQKKPESPAPHQLGGSHQPKKSHVNGGNAKESQNGGGDEMEEKDASPREKQHVEERRVTQMQAVVKNVEESGIQLMILLRMSDQMNRQLVGEIAEADSPDILAEELVYHGFIHKEDSSQLAELISESIIQYKSGICPDVIMPPMPPVPPVATLR